jgi:hypothetical protein
VAAVECEIERLTQSIESRSLSYIANLLTDDEVKQLAVDAGRLLLLRLDLRQLEDGEYTDMFTRQWIVSSPSCLELWVGLYLYFTSKW